MLSYIKKYPVSLFIILAVIYLSFFKPPSTEISKIPNIDKIVHICMYFGMSGMLWLEFLRAHRRDHTPIWHRSFRLSCIIQWMCRIATGILHYLSRRRLVGLCRQYHRSGIGQSDRVFCSSSTDGSPKVTYYRNSTTVLSLMPFEPLIRMV